MNNFSKEVSLDGQLGQIYNNLQIAGRIDFPTHIPTSFRLVGSISSFDYFETFTVGLELQPYMRAYFKPWVYASAGLSFTAHLFHFIKDESMLYEPNYTFVSLTPFIGFGFRFGGVQ